MKPTSVLHPILFAMLAFASTVLMTSSCTNPQPTEGEAAVEIAKEAFTYGLPLVLMDISRRQQTNVPQATNGAGAPMNQLNNLSYFPNASDTAVVAPNADTYYCTAWGDFREGPLVFYMPNTYGRYFVMPFLDAFTNVFESIGPRTGTGGGGTFFITRDSTTALPDTSMTRIYCPTSFFWLLGRIQCNGTQDGIDTVIPLQKQMKLMPYKYWKQQSYTPPPGRTNPNLSKKSPNDIVSNMGIDSFFNYLNILLTDNRTPPDNEPALEKFRKINVGRGMKFSSGALGLNENQLKTLNQIPQTLYAEYRADAAKASKAVQGWVYNTTGMGTYGTDYKQRAVVAIMGLGCNLPQDAVYPSSYVDVTSGNKYVGTNKYTMTFKKGELPPVEGFWSLTMYNQKGYFVANPDSIYAIGHNTSRKFTYNPDGSLTLYIQNQQPALKNNWLPAPPAKDTFYLMMRLYYPSETAPSILNGSWSPPGVVINQN